MAESAGTRAQARPRLALLAGVAGYLLAFALLARMAIFLHDPGRPEFSIRPSDPFRVQHSCLTAYAEASRFVLSAGENIYRESLYDGRHLGGFKVDTYHYPPPFLLLPGAALAVAGDYLALRPLWFYMQLATLLAALLVMSRFVGGVLGRAMLLAAPLLLIAPVTLHTLQMGNFQITAFSLALIGMVALGARSTAAQAAGGLALAYASLSKIFPGILALYLLISGRWRAAAWTAAAGVALVLVTLWIHGPQPFTDFANYEVPRLSSGEAFPQSEWARTAAVNQSFYGFTVKLRVLGASFLTAPVGRVLSSVYGLMVVALAVVLAWRARARARLRPEAVPGLEIGQVLDSRARLDALLVLLALLNLASLRSPFVGGGYGVGGTIWLLVLLLVSDWRRSSLRFAASAAVLVTFFAVGLLIPGPRGPEGVLPPIWVVVVAAGLQALAFAINGGVVWGALRRSRRVREPLPAADRLVTSAAR